MPDRNRRLKNPIFSGCAIALMGLSACTPKLEEKLLDPATDAEINTETAPANDTSANQIENDPERGRSLDRVIREAPSPDEDYAINRATSLLLGPRPDREPPLEDCGSLTTQTDMNLCAQKNYARVEEELSFIYQARQKVLPEAGQTALASAESAWTNFRELDCRFERDKYAGGSIAPLIYNTCLTEHTIDRTDELYEPELAQDSYEYADGILNAHYQTLQGLLTDARLSELTDAQLAWIEYRDRHCAFEARYAQLDIQADQCKARLTEERTRQLQAATEQNSL